MVFSSYEFIFLFLPLTVIGYYFFSKYISQVAAKWLLLSASMVFYGFWNLSYLSLFIASIVFNYQAGCLISTTKYKNLVPFKTEILLLSIVSNILILFSFKYADFFILNWNYLAGHNIGYLHILFPLGISFFTLQQIGYLVDVYQDVSREKSFLNYALFISFFPQLVAGPICRHQELGPQFENSKFLFVSYRNIFCGLVLLSIGLFKKVIIADGLGGWVNDGFSQIENLNFVEAWITSLGFTAQIYFDFSAYTDIALGIALLFNIHLPINFNSPYKSTSIIDFWTRWHMSLSKFVFAYIYAPLVRFFANKSFAKNMIIIFFVFIVVGLWHGPSWTFIAFGGLHGFALIINYMWRRLVKIRIKNWACSFVGWIITFIFINFSFIVFRANNIEDAIFLYSSMINFESILVPEIIISVGFFHHIPFVESSINWLPVFGNDLMIPLGLVCAYFIIFSFSNSTQLLERVKPNLVWTMSGCILFSVSIISFTKVSEFIYFRF